MTLGKPLGFSEWLNVLLGLLLPLYLLGSPELGVGALPQQERVLLGEAGIGHKPCPAAPTPDSGVRTTSNLQCQLSFSAATKHMPARSPLSQS